ncbi:MAG: hypothetical protein ACM4AI_04605 [Acidobacteriota bacterium]
MTFTETSLPGVWVIDADEFPDARGAFVLAWTPEPIPRSPSTGRWVRRARSPSATRRIRTLA